MAATMEEQSYHYVRPSELTFGDGRADLMLATSGGRTATGPAAHPVFFDGFLGHPEQAAAALLAVAKVARTRFYKPPGMVAAILRAADPVVTSNRDRLRFESFSACCGVYARYDALPGSLDGTLLDTGTTNVDFNPPMRDALARIGGLEPLHLQVGEDVIVRTLDAEVTEKKVPLPERWLKGFAEVQLASATVTPVFDVAASEARRFIRSLPSSGSRKPVWVVPAGRGLRITTRPTPDAVSLSGLDRLKPLEPLLRFARSLRAYAGPHDPQGATGVWELELDDARLVLALSPESSRGFSGEGECSGTSRTSSPPTTRTSSVPCSPSNRASTSTVSLLSPASPRTESSARSVVLALPAGSDTTPPKPRTSIASCPMTRIVSPRCTPASGTRQRWSRPAPCDSIVRPPTSAVATPNTSCAARSRGIAAPARGTPSTRAVEVPASTSWPPIW